MKPRTKKPTRPIHVTLPIRLLEDFDETLRYNQSRSAKIALLIAGHLKGESEPIGMASIRTLMIYLKNHEDIEPWLSRVLTEVLAQ